MLNTVWRMFGEVAWTLDENVNKSENSAKKSLNVPKLKLE